ncbi:MAG: PrsW family glutamic-type intramembrane protease, partial [Solirubrobacteraceae bacterium]
IRGPFDGLILGAFVGLGFQISENISYAWIGAANSFGDLGATCVMEQLFAVLRLVAPDQPRELSHRAP